jgi:hypothetical protein
MKTDIAASRIIAWNCLIGTILLFQGDSQGLQLEDADIQFHASCVYIIAFVGLSRNLVGVSINHR